MPNQTAAANVRPLPWANKADGPDPLPALRREMKLLLVEQNLMQIELNQRRAAEGELREAKELFLAYVEQLSVMEAELRKAIELWRREAERMAQEKPRYSRWGWHYLFRLKSPFGRAVASLKPRAG
jgi:hypothetical protein